MRRFLSIALPCFRAERAAPFATAPVAIVVAQGAAVRVIDRNGEAARAGIRAGMTLAEARARLPELRIEPEDPAADAAVLARLGDWAIGFGPGVHLLPPGALAVEVGGSAHLFGGERPLAERAVRDLAGRGLTAAAVVAGTIGAGLALAGFGGEAVTVVRPGEEAAALGPLRPEALRLDERDVRRLRSLGVRAVADLLALGRADLRARFGESLVRRIAEALGEVEEPLALHAPERRFRTERAFPEPIEGGEPLLRSVERLVDEAASWLLGRLEGARRLGLEVATEDGTIAIEVGLTAPAREPKLLRALFRTRLEGLRLGSRATAIALEVRESAALPFAQAAIEPERGGRRAGAPAVVRPGPCGAGAPALDRLAARLGERAVLRAELVEDHRPERAFRLVPAARVKTGARKGGVEPARAEARLGEGGPRGPRPPRIFEPPRPIAVRVDPEGCPIAVRPAPGGVRAVRGPERLAGAWWAGGGGRDYFEVEAAGGRRLWIFRADGGKWFLHGDFG